MTINSETELYIPIKSFWENRGYRVKSEVRGCDMVVLKEEEPEPIIIELKKSFNLSLIFQGLDRLKISSTVFLAVERLRSGKRPVYQKWNEIQNLCIRLGLGLITVTFYKTKKPFVEIICEPPLTINENQNNLKKPRKPSKKTSLLLQEFNERSGDYNVGGSHQTKLVTAYRELALQCAYFISVHGQLSPLQLRELTGKQKASSILQKNYYGWFKRIERGKYGLSEGGEEALIEFGHIL